MSTWNQILNLYQVWTMCPYFPLLFRVDLSGRTKLCPAKHLILYYCAKHCLLFWLKILIVTSYVVAKPVPNTRYNLPGGNYLSKTYLGSIIKLKNQLMCDTTLTNGRDMISCLTHLSVSFIKRMLQILKPLFYYSSISIRF